MKSYFMKISEKEYEFIISERGAAKKRAEELLKAKKKRAEELLNAVIFDELEQLCKVVVHLLNDDENIICRLFLDWKEYSKDFSNNKAHRVIMFGYSDLCDLYRKLDIRPVADIQ